MAINMMCMNSKCKYYYEDNCIRYINEERIEIDENGMCETFKEGVSEWYNNIEEGLKVWVENIYYYAIDIIVYLVMIGAYGEVTEKINVDITAILD